MKELLVDMWVPAADARVILTNGMTTSRGYNPMGGGCAWEAAQRHPNLPYELGQLLLNEGNKVFWFEDYHLYTFPTKDNPAFLSDMNLIEKSCKELVELVDQNGQKSVIVPQPGTGLGGLSWPAVRDVCKKYLDDRFTVVGYPVKINA